MYCWTDEFYEQALHSFPSLRDYIVSYIGHEDDPNKLMDFLFALETDVRSL